VRNAVLHDYKVEYSALISEETLTPYLLGDEKIKFLASTHPTTNGNRWKTRYFTFNNLGDKWDSKIMAEEVIKAFD